MIVPPFSCPSGFSEGLEYQGGQEGYVYLFQEGKELLLINSKDQTIPSMNLFPLKRSVYLGTLMETFAFFIRNFK